MKDMIKHCEKLIEQRKNSINLLYKAVEDWGECSITLKYKDDTYSVPHYMRDKIISDIIEEEKLSINRLESQKRIYSKKA